MKPHCCCGRWRMDGTRLLPPALTPGASAWNSKTALKAQAYVNKSLLAELRFIWESGCQHSFSDLPAPSNNIDPTFLPAASRAGQPRLTSVGTVQGTGHMNSTILHWPTLAPLFQAMNRAVWKKKGKKFTQKVKAAKFVSLWWFQDWVKKSFFTWCCFTFSFTNRKHFLAREEAFPQKRKVTGHSAGGRTRSQRQGFAFPFITALRGEMLPGNHQGVGRSGRPSWAEPPVSAPVVLLLYLA